MNPIRAVLAWLVAVVAISWCALFTMLLRGNNVAEAFASSIGILPVVAPLGALFGAVPSAIAIWMLRWSRAPRPWGDMAAAALASVVALFIYSPPNFAPAETYDFSVDGFLAGIALFLSIGAVPGGLVYWFLAGRPRPPYHPGHPHAGQSRAP